MPNFFTRITYALCSLLLCSSVTAKILTGVVTQVSDGDTLWVQLAEGGAPVKVRFQGMDAPEGCQDWGPQAKQALKKHTLRKTVQLDTRARDTFGRIVARVSLAEQDVAAWMVGQGHAWSQHYRQSNGPYAEEERSARSARRGLWAGAAPVEPSVFRKQHGPCVYPSSKNKPQPNKIERKQLPQQ